MKIDLTTVLSSWPFWTAVTIIAVVLILRTPLVALVSRTQRFKLFGASVDVREQRQQSGGSLPLPQDVIAKEVQEVQRGGEAKDARTAADELLRHVPRNEYVALRERQIEDALTDLGIASDPVQKARALLTAVAVSAISAEFERLYSAIWGSQIKLLQALNIAATTTEQLRPIYEQAVSSYPEAYKTYTFDQWPAFISHQGVIEVSQGRAAITLKGRSFLVYLAHEGKSFERTG